jgi:hypothetical protein
MMDLTQFDVPLTEPWASMDLPVEGGSVNRSDDIALIVAFQEEDRSASEVGQEWLAALGRAGFEGADPSEVDESAYLVLVRKDGQVRQLSVMSLLGNMIVSLTQMELPDEAELPGAP